MAQPPVGNYVMKDAGAPPTNAEIAKPHTDKVKSGLAGLKDKLLGSKKKKKKASAKTAGASAVGASPRRKRDRGLQSAAVVTPPKVSERRSAISEKLGHAPKQMSGMTVSGGSGRKPSVARLSARLKAISRKKTIGQGK